MNPQPSNHLHKLIFLSYALPSTPGAPTQYSKGPHDLLFVAFYTIFLTFTRESIMQLLLRPLALHFHISTRSKQLRFMEQSYTALYFGLLGPIGLSVMSRTPVWYFNIAGMYADFPHKTISGEFKAYYLFQAAYWAQQGIVIGLRLEKPRKDFWQLVGHHVVTLVLIATSYRFHFTYMGIGVFITHDLSDCFFAVSSPLVPSSQRTLCLDSNAQIDFEDTALHQLPLYGPVLHPLHRRLGLPTPLSQPPHPSLRVLRVQDCGAIHVELGNGTV